MIRASILCDLGSFYSSSVLVHFRWKSTSVSVRFRWRYAPPKLFEPTSGTRILNKLLISILQRIIITDLTIDLIDLEKYLIILLFEKIGSYSITFKSIIQQTVSMIQISFNKMLCIQRLRPVSLIWFVFSSIQAI